MTQHHSKVVLFFPAFSSLEATAPLSLLALATPLLKAGYDVHIIDSTISPDYQRCVLYELRDAVALCISLVTGPMIRETIKLGLAAKAMFPKLPIILGGWHPSLLAGQTIEADFVDAVVRGQGENVIVELLDRLRAGEQLAGLKGVSYKHNGEVFHNLPSELIPITSLPSKAYHLADVDAYQRITGRRWLMYISSLGCPYDCSYCTNAAVYQRKWNALPAEQVVDEIAQLVTTHRLDLLWVVDDNFLVDVERAVDIAEGLVRRNLNEDFRWSIQATTNLVCKLSVDELKTLRQSGLQQICHGAESASASVLASMNKSWQKIEMIYEAARRCVEARIRPSFNIIFGYPGETQADRRETVDVICAMCKRYPGVEFWTNIFTPYPSSPVMRHARELGIEIPDSLEGWADFFPRYTTLPWLRGREHRQVQNMRDCLRLAYKRETIAVSRVSVAPVFNRWGNFSASALGNGVRRCLMGMLRWPARWRLRWHYYGFPLEIWAKNTAKRILEARKQYRNGKTAAPTSTITTASVSEQPMEIIRCSTGSR